MKKHILLIITISFFVLLNTSYFWLGKLGVYAYPAGIGLLVLYFILAITFVFQLYFLIVEKFRFRYRIIVVSVMLIVLGSTLVSKDGIFGFGNRGPKDLLIAEREGAANCYTTLKLKADNKFIEESVCFGMSEIRGTYSRKGDSIFFSNIELGRGESEYYQFAVISSEFQNEKILGELKRFKNYSDTLPHDLFITKNEFKK